MILCPKRFREHTHQSKKEGKDQESIQSSTTSDPVYQWESDTNESQEVSPFPASDHNASINRLPRGLEKCRGQLIVGLYELSSPDLQSVCFEISAFSQQGFNSIT